MPRPDDIFQERLYCIRWVETVERSDGSLTTRRHYRAPDAHDLQREDKVLQLLRERFHSWQEKGYLPSRRIEPGTILTSPSENEAGRTGIICFIRGSCWCRGCF